MIHSTLDGTFYFSKGILCVFLSIPHHSQMRNGRLELLTLFTKNVHVWGCGMVEPAWESASVDCTTDFISIPLLYKSYQELSGESQQLCLMSQTSRSEARQGSQLRVSHSEAQEKNLLPTYARCWWN